MKFVSLLFAAALTAHATAASPATATRTALCRAAPPCRHRLRLRCQHHWTTAAALADKAHRHGAIAWRINAASSGNRLYGSAIIYQ